MSTALERTVRDFAATHRQVGNCSGPRLLPSEHNLIRPFYFAQSNPVAYLYIQLLQYTLGSLNLDPCLLLLSNASVDEIQYYWISDQA